MFDKLFSFGNTFGQELFPNTSTSKKGEKQDQKKENIEKRKQAMETEQ